MPLKENHGLYGTIMSAMPFDVKCEVLFTCDRSGIKKGYYILNVFGKYDSRRIIDQWFRLAWNKYKFENIKDYVEIGKGYTRAHYDKVIKMMPDEIRRDVFILAAMHGLKKIALVENIFGAYSFEKIIDAWFRAIWTNEKSKTIASVLRN